MRKDKEIVLDNDVIRSTNIGGVGGKEKLLQDFFCKSSKVVRINHSIYDFIVNDQKIEVKKQQNGQWFDYAKYHNLDDEHLNIIMMFIIHKKGETEIIFTITLGNFLKIVCNDPEFRCDGWTLQDISDAYDKKSKYPKLEYKAPLNIRKFYTKYKDHVSLLYNCI